MTKAVPTAYRHGTFEQGVRTVSHQPHPLAAVAHRWAAFANALGLSERPLRDRLRDEYTWVLDPVIESTIEALPKRLADELNSLESQMTSVPDSVTGSIAASIEAMSDDDVRRITGRLLDIGHVVGAYAWRIEGNSDGLPLVTVEEQECPGPSSAVT